MFISTTGKGARASLSHAARMTSGSRPNSCAARGVSSGVVYKSSFVFSLPYFSPFALTISVNVSPAPYLSHSLRKGSFV